MDSKTDPQEINLDRFPLVSHAEGSMGEIEKAQMLFYSAGASHYVESEDLNVAISYSWTSHQGNHHTKSQLREQWIKVHVTDSPFNLWNRFKAIVKWVLRRQSRTG